MTVATRGVIFIHSAPSALCPHVEWAIAGVLGLPVDLDWIAQPVEQGTYRAELSWSGAAGTAATLASSMRGWQDVRFEVAEEPTVSSEGARFSYTPSLGIFHAPTGLHGDMMIPEDRIRACLVRAHRGEIALEKSLEQLLGHAWDSELEPFRQAGEGTRVRWLHQVV